MEYLIISFIAFYVLFWLYLAIMNLKRARDNGTLTKFTLYFSYPMAIFGYILDIAVNWIIATVVFLNIPKEATLSHRLERYVQGPDNWRKSVALWMAHNLLDPFDPDGHHIDKD